MNYTRIYTQLIERARSRSMTGYMEQHHILPRCMGGTDESSNLVNLTPEEHYVAHQLLVKMYPGNARLVHAATMMGAIRPSNKMYGWLRRRLSTNMKRNNPNAGGKARRGKPVVRKAVLSEAGRKSISEHMKRNNPNADGSCRLKVTQLVDDTGVVAHEYASVKDAVTAHKANHGSMLRHMKAGTKYRGFVWRFHTT